MRWSTLRCKHEVTSGAFTTHRSSALDTRRQHILSWYGDGFGLWSFRLEKKRISYDSMMDPTDIKSVKLIYAKQLDVYICVVVGKTSNQVLLLDASTLMLVLEWKSCTGLLLDLDFNQTSQRIYFAIQTPSISHTTLEIAEFSRKGSSILAQTIFSDILCDGIVQELRSYMVPNGGTLLFCRMSDSRVLEWSDSTKRIEKDYSDLFSESNSPATVLHVLNSRMFATGHNDGTICIWDRQSDEENKNPSSRLTHVAAFFNEKVANLAVNEEGLELFATSDSGAIRHLKCEIRACGSDHTLICQVSGEFSCFQAVDQPFHYSSLFVYDLNEWAHHVKVLIVVFGQAVYFLQIYSTARALGCEKAITSAAHHTCNEFDFIVLCEDSTLTKFKFDTSHNEIHEMNEGCEINEKRAITSICLISNKELCIGFEDGQLNLFSLATMKLTKNCHETAAPISSLCYTDCRVIYAGTESGQMVEWDPQRRKIKSWTAHSMRIICLQPCVVSDKKMIISACTDGSVTIWNVSPVHHIYANVSTTSGPALSSLYFFTNELRGNEIQGLCGFDDGTIKAVKLSDSTSSVVETLREHCQRVTNISSVCHQTRVLSASLDCSCILWNIPKSRDSLSVATFYNFAHPVLQCLDLGSAIIACHPHCLSIWSFVDLEALSTMQFAFPPPRLVHLEKSGIPIFEGSKESYSYSTSALNVPTSFSCSTSDGVRELFAAYQRNLSGPLRSCDLARLHKKLKFPSVPEKFICNYIAQRHLKPVFEDSNEVLDILQDISNEYSKDKAPKRERGQYFRMCESVVQVSFNSMGERCMKSISLGDGINREVKLPPVVKREIMDDVKTSDIQAVVPRQFMSFWDSGFCWCDNTIYISGTLPPKCPICRKKKHSVSPDQKNYSADTLSALIHMVYALASEESSVFLACMQSENYLQEILYQIMSQRYGIRTLVFSKLLLLFTSISSYVNVPLIRTFGLLLGGCRKSEEKEELSIACEGVQASLAGMDFQYLGGTLVPIYLTAYQWLLRRQHIDTKNEFRGCGSKISVDIAEQCCRETLRYPFVTPSTLQSCLRKINYSESQGGQVDLYWHLAMIVDELYQAYSFANSANRALFGIRKNQVQQDPDILKLKNLLHAFVLRDIKRRGLLEETLFSDIFKHSIKFVWADIGISDIKSITGKIVGRYIDLDFGGLISYLDFWALIFVCFKQKSRLESLNAYMDYMDNYHLEIDESLKTIILQYVQWSIFPVHSDALENPHRSGVLNLVATQRGEGCPEKIAKDTPLNALHVSHAHVGNETATALHRHEVLKSRVREPYAINESQESSAMIKKQSCYQSNQRLISISGNLNQIDSTDSQQSAPVHPEEPTRRIAEAYSTWYIESPHVDLGYQPCKADSGVLNRSLTTQQRQGVVEKFFADARKPVANKNISTTLYAKSAQANSRLKPIRSIKRQRNSRMNRKKAPVAFRSINKPKEVTKSEKISPKRNEIDRDFNMKASQALVNDEVLLTPSDIPKNDSTIEAGKISVADVVMATTFGEPLTQSAVAESEPGTDFKLCEGFDFHQQKEMPDEHLECSDVEKSIDDPERQNSACTNHSSSSDSSDSISENDTIISDPRDELYESSVQLSSDIAVCERNTNGMDTPETFSNVQPATPSPRKSYQMMFSHEVSVIPLDLIRLARHQHQWDPETASDDNSDCESVGNYSENKRQSILERQQEIALHYSNDTPGPVLDTTKMKNAFSELSRHFDISAAFDSAGDKCCDAVESRGEAKQDELGSIKLGNNSNVTELVRYGDCFSFSSIPPKKPRRFRFIHSNPSGIITIGIYVVRGSGHMYVSNENTNPTSTSYQWHCSFSENSPTTRCVIHPTDGNMGTMFYVTLCSKFEETSVEIELMCSGETVEESGTTAVSELISKFRSLSRSISTEGIASEAELQTDIINAEDQGHQWSLIERDESSSEDFRKLLEAISLKKSEEMQTLDAPDIRNAGVLPAETSSTTDFDFGEINHSKFEIKGKLKHRLRNKSAIRKAMTPVAYSITNSRK